MLLCSAAFADEALLKPLAVPAAPATSATPPDTWHITGLPRQTKPFTRFALVDVDGKPALRVEAESSYGNLVHPVANAAPALKLSWSWRVDQLIDAADLHTRDGDDTAIKVCVFFDEPLERVPFVERQILRAARSNAVEPIPAATVCYVWDAHMPAGSKIDSAFTHRLRYKILQSGPAHLREWVKERRDVAADFTELFGTESAEVPPVIGIAIGADADNTKSRSLAYVSELVLAPSP